ncbi:MAG: hypothetical protein AAF500_22405 [Myxococcota bacterium]
MRAGQQLEAFSTLLALVASIALHGAAFGYVMSRNASYDFAFELTLPTEVEFGLTDAMASAGATDAAPAGTFGVAPPASSGVTGSPALGPDAGVPDTETDLGEEEARRSEEEPEPTDDTPPEPEQVDADELREERNLEEPRDPIPVGPSTITGPSRIPPGAQLALRIDIERIRRSPLGPDVTKFLAGVPDWQLLLDGSGIEPVEDLDRLLVASPNLQRSRLVLAGRHHGGSAFVTSSVQRMAKARGRRAPWTRRHGVRTAPWHNRDATRRTIAALGENHFTITRPQDLGRVLAMAKARELRDPEDEGLVPARGPDALLSMGPDEAISLEIEGVHRFVRGNLQHVPSRLRVAVRETGENRATVTALATFASDAKAQQASAFWQNVVDFYSQQLFVSLAGFRKTLRGLSLKPDGDRIKVSFDLNADQVRFILSYLEGRLQGRRSTSAPPTRRKAPPAAPSTQNGGADAKKGP